MDQFMAIKLSHIELKLQDYCLFWFFSILSNPTSTPPLPLVFQFTLTIVHYVNVCITTSIDYTTPPLKPLCWNAISFSKLNPCLTPHS